MQCASSVYAEPVSPNRRIFLLSPANCSGKRAGFLLRKTSRSPLAQRLRSGDGASIGEVFTFMSGLFTPVDSMPHWVQIAAEFNPVRHFVSISRAILIKGAGLAEIARPLIILVVFAVATFSLAVGQYRKRTA